MITVKKDAIKFKDSNGNMQSAGVLCNIGVRDGSDSLMYRIIGQPYEYENDDILNISTNAFNRDHFVKRISLPNAESIAQDSIYLCNNLESINLPKLKTAQGTQHISNCNFLKEIVLPLAEKTLDTRGNKLMEKADYANAKSFVQHAFNSCYSLKTVILRNEGVVSLGDTNTTFNACYHFDGTVNETYNPLGLLDGFVYVPRAWIESYKTATNWSKLHAIHPNIFRALEDYTVDGTITGAIDESKL